MLYWGKIILFLVLAAMLYYQLFEARNMAKLWQQLVARWQWSLLPFLILAALLMPVNWLLETWKWKVLLNGNAGWGQLMKGVSAGVTFGFITPGRVGEFVGRTFYLEHTKKSDVFLLSLIGGLAQTAATLLFGTLFFSISDWYQPFVAGLTIGLTSVFLFFYFRFDLLNKLLMRLPFKRLQHLAMTPLQLPALNVTLKVLLLSVIRYGVYLSQYVLMMLFMGVDIGLLPLYVNSGLVLLLQSFSPLLPYLDFSYRGTVAIFVFHSQTDNPLAVVAAVTFVWLFNLVLPALVGYFFIWRHKFQYLKQN